VAHAAAAQSPAPSGLSFERERRGTRVQLRRQQIAKLVGVAPLNRDSGQSQGKRRIYGGRAEVRVALYMATLSAVRWEPAMKAHYQQLRARGKVAKFALVACMRKLLTIVNARRRDELRGAELAIQNT